VLMPDEGLTLLLYAAEPGSPSQVALRAPADEARLTSVD